MEVHHHSHTPDPNSHRGGKKWTHYFWEFLMLFLAVFCGYLAENFREHTVEHRREKQFIRSMIQDLRSDTTQLAIAIDLLQKREIMIDSFIMILGSPDFKLRGNEIYFFGRQMTVLAYFFPNDRTILQLKYSGSLRLIRDMVVSDSIMLYDQEMRSLLYQFTDESTIRAELRQVALDKFNGQIFFSMLDKNISFKINRPSGNPQLIKQDAGSINELVTQSQYLKNVSRNLRSREQHLKEKAVRLIQQLKKAYHL